MAGLGQPGCFGVVTASGRQPPLEGRDPPEVGCEEDLGDPDPVRGDDLRAGSGHLLGVGEPAGLSQGEHLVDQVHGRVGDG